MSKKLTILIRVAQLWGGGAERVAVDLANGLADRGHKVILATDIMSYPIMYPPSKKVKVHNIANHNKNHIKCMRPFVAISKEKKLLLDYKPDAYIGIMHLYPILGRIAKFFTYGCHTKIIYSDHDSFERPKTDPMPFYDYIYKYWLSKLCNALTVLTEADKQCLGSRKNVYVMPNPLSLKPYYKEVNRKKVILAMGRLDAYKVKGFDLLMIAWSQLCEKYPDWELHIAGNDIGEYERKIRNFALTPSIGNSVKFLGFQTDIESLYREAEIFVLSSRFEGFGLVLIEAMSQGCACIACDYKGRQREIISNEEDGLICEPDSYERLKECLERLILDDSLRNKLHKNAPYSISRYSYSETAIRWENMINTLLNN